jgi:hypothetical protein
MEWLSRLRGILSLSGQRRTLVLYHKRDSYDLDVCTPKIIRRERRFWREDRLDLFHLKPDGNTEYKPLS